MRARGRSFGAWGGGSCGRRGCLRVHLARLAVWVHGTARQSRPRQAAQTAPTMPVAVTLAKPGIGLFGRPAGGVRRGLRRREYQERCPELPVVTPTARDARHFET